ncbi:hypothetical protein F5148DRAFT_743315 [Russula earlei]|uniref:Uncharacterized protein n=1 Tax=Russula earlei TaxID=71964 RepID=A0ACC0TT38_9AGAM|nr:hypothetical protein F5148DRAFT_743315 [Russula earlei]
MLYDNIAVVDWIQELGLRPYMIHDPLEVADKATCPPTHRYYRRRFAQRGKFQYRVYGRCTADRDDPSDEFHQSLPCLNLKWCLDNSISSEVTTPVSTQDLASALISALGRKEVKISNVFHVHCKVSGRETHMTCTRPLACRASPSFVPRSRVLLPILLPFLLSRALAFRCHPQLCARELRQHPSPIAFDVMRLAFNASPSMPRCQCLARPPHVYAQTP